MEKKSVEIFGILETTIENMEEYAGASNLDDSLTYKWCKSRLEDFRKEISDEL